MFGFLGFILIIILFIVIFAVAILGNIIRTIFGLGKRVPKFFHGDKKASSQSENVYTSSQRTTTSSSSNGKKKIFADNEGEYVEFEEVN